MAINKKVLGIAKCTVGFTRMAGSLISNEIKILMKKEQSQEERQKAKNDFNLSVVLFKSGIYDLTEIK